MLIFSQLLTAALFGSMVFFSFVMAPLIFAKLDEATAGQFIRAVFPWYYLLLVVLSLAAGIPLFAAAPLEAGILLGCASTAVFARQMLMPRINRLRDAALGGNAVAGKHFDQLHRLSVLINMVQLVGVTAVFILLALP